MDYFLWSMDAFFSGFKTRPPFTTVIKLGGARIFLNIPPIVFIRKESYTPKMACEWQIELWDNFHFWVNYPFKDTTKELKSTTEELPSCRPQFQSCSTPACNFQVNLNTSNIQYTNIQINMSWLFSFYFVGIWHQENLHANSLNLHWGDMQGNWDARDAPVSPKAHRRHLEKYREEKWQFLIIIIYCTY